MYVSIIDYVASRVIIHGKKRISLTTALRIGFLQATSQQRHGPYLELYKIKGRHESYDVFFTRLAWRESKAFRLVSAENNRKLIHRRPECNFRSCVTRVKRPQRVYFFPFES